MASAELQGKEKSRIREILIGEGLVPPAEVAEILEVQRMDGGKFVEVLVSLGYVDIDIVARFLASQPGIPSIELANYRVSRELYSLIPYDFAVKQEVFPIDRLGNLLTVGMAFPLDSATIDHMSEVTGLKIKVLLCSADDIRGAIAEYCPSGKEKTSTVYPQGK